MSEDSKTPEEEFGEYLTELTEMVNNSDFEDRYGFPHDCRCDADWQEGNVAMASVCFMKMAEDALDRCYRYKGEVAGLVREGEALRIQVRELGGEPRV